MKTPLRLCSCASTAFGVIAAGFIVSASVGCRTAASTNVAANDSAFVPLPPIEREVGPDGSEVTAGPAPDAQAAPKSWSRKFADFCTPKPPPKSNSNRVLETDSVPYTD